MLVEECKSIFLKKFYQLFNDPGNTYHGSMTNMKRSEPAERNDKDNILSMKNHAKCMVSLSREIFGQWSAVNTTIRKIHSSDHTGAAADIENRIGGFYNALMTYLRQPNYLRKVWFEWYYLVTSQNTQTLKQRWMISGKINSF